MAENNDPTFQVQRIETSHGAMTALVPQFQAGDLSDDERADYDALRDVGVGHHSGAIAVAEIAESYFEAGETVTLADVEERYEKAISEVKEEFEELASVAQTFTSVMDDLAEAARPLAEEMDIEDSDHGTPP